MNIKLGQYVITSDPHQLILSEIKIAKEGKNAGQELRQPLAITQNWSS